MSTINPLTEEELARLEGLRVEFRRASEAHPTVKGRDYFETVQAHDAEAIDTFPRLLATIRAERERADIEREAASEQRHAFTLAKEAAEQFRSRAEAAEADAHALLAEAAEALEPLARAAMSLDSFTNPDPDTRQWPSDVRMPTVRQLRFARAAYDKLRGGAR